MKVGIVGSRDWPRGDLVADYVHRIARKYPDATIVSGGARGVDTVAERTAGQLGLQVVSYRPYCYANMAGGDEWSIETLMFPHGSSERRINSPYFPTFRDAAMHRNGWIVDDSDHVVAFWLVGTTGTADTIAKAEAAGKLREVIRL